MQKISDRAAKGKTEAESYKDVIRNIPILSANQKTIWEQVQYILKLSLFEKQ